jgi:hypothetical protein
MRDSGNPRDCEHCGLFGHKFAPIVLFFFLSLSFVEKIYTSVVA